WTYAGNNLAQNRPNYVYWSIDRSQGRLNCDFFHLLAFINPSNRPQGSIDFDELEITYRNHSVLLPSNGGRLTSAPGDDLHAAAALTDGWRSGPGHEWTSAASPKVPQEFLWQLDHPVTVTAVQVHQHSLWPAKDVEVHLSVD